MADHELRMRTISIPCDLSGELPEVDLAIDEHTHIVVVRPVVRRAEVGLLEAWPRSALLVPAPWSAGRHPISAVLHAIHEARRVEQGCVIAVGWPARDAEETTATVQARVEGLRALVEGDCASWTKIGAAHGSLADVLAYIDYLGRDRGFECSAASIGPAENDDSRAAVSSFQSMFNARFGASIDVDGVCGEQTLGAMFDVLRFEWDHWLGKHGLTADDVSRVHFEYLAATDRTAKHAPTDPDGGVDLLVVERASLGGRQVDGAMLSTLYAGDLVRRIEYPVAAEPGGWQSGSYTVITDVAAGEVMLPEIYNLRATDGSFARSLILPDEAVDNGFLELRFTDLPCDRRYRLDVEIVGVGIYEIFADLAYSELHMHAENIEENRG
jgi:hypothetical protein